MQSEKQILPGTAEWDALCEQCGLCCLMKTFDKNNGRMCLTRVRCGQLDQKTRKCHCYCTDYNKRDGANGDSCIARGGSPVNMYTLHNEYVVPGFCPYVKKFVGPNKLERPSIDFNQTISEDEMKPGEQLQDYIIPGTCKYFRYNPVLNKKLENLFVK